MAKYFITGGSGFLGINLVRYLLEKNHTVVTYDIEDFAYPEKSKVTHVKGDIRDYQTLEEAMKGSDVVVHAAAALPLYKKEDIFSTDVLGTEHVLRCALSNNVSRFIHVSSTAVYGIPDHHPLREDDELSGVGHYGIAKIEAEKTCEAYRKKGLVVSIVRPKSFIGPERLGVFALLYDWALTGHNFPLIGNGKNRYQLLDVYDLCEAIYLCATKDAGEVNTVFNIGAKDFKTMREDYQAVLDVAGFGKKIIPFPAWPAIAILRILEALHLSPLYKWVYETASKDSFVSIERAETVLGWNPRYSNKDALIRNFEWYKEHLHDFKDTGGVSHRVPWKQGVLKLLKLFF